MNLDKWQKEFLATKGDKILCTGRQVGKSVICAMDAGNWALDNDDATVLMIAPTERQSYALFEKTMSYIVNTDDRMVAEGKDKPTKKHLTLTNGTKIWSLPTGLSGRGVRFLTIGRLYADETSRIPQPVFDAVSPMLATTGGDTVYLSTPAGKEGEFYDCWANEDGSYDSFTRFHVDTETVFKERKICLTWSDLQREKSLAYLAREKIKKTAPKEAVKKDRAAEIANTFEWLITAFILAFVFRAFVMEAFRIPTGSMADTLKGAHFRLRCLQCGYKYDHGYVPQEYRQKQDTIPSEPAQPPRTRCPSCGHYPVWRNLTPVSNGDRILVLKCIYQFFEPRRWDVSVFKNPLEPKINYIKRLVGLPGERLEIIDGDLYVNDQISRKPRKVQEELWMPVYDNDYQPMRPNERSFNDHQGRVWRQPFDLGRSQWRIDNDNHTVFRLDSSDGGVHQMVYDTTRGNDFSATYAYNNIMGYRNRPYCSDLMVRFYANPGDGESSVGIGLSKYQTHYLARYDPAGEMIISKDTQSGKEVLACRTIERIAVGTATPVRFSNIDHELIFEVGSEKLVHDLGRGATDAGPRRKNIEPQVRILGSGKLSLWHVGIFRDIYYTGKMVNGMRGARASEGSAFTLGEDQFFVLGDNSPNSQDSRWWSSEGIGNNDRKYRAGVVPRDYLVGKALFVYWPSGFKPFAKFFAIVPNVGQMRFIYGGSGRNPH